MRSVDSDTITDAVIGTIDSTATPRVRELAAALVRHIHAFARETSLTHEEWRKGLELLRWAGDITTDERNEFVLFSDVWGLSSLVDTLHSPKDATPSSVLGPFHILGAPPLAVGGDLKSANDGATVFIDGKVLDPDGKPIAGAKVEVWQTAINGLYSNQDEAQPDYNLRATITTGADGRYGFSTVRPAPYTVPTDGPVGATLAATGRHNWRPSHLHFVAQAPGFRTLVTEVFPSDDPYLDEDTVFGVRSRLVFDYVARTGATSLPKGFARGVGAGEEFFTVDFDILLKRAPVG
jgi:hydroxyquinol 1,2-dioxygenase